MPTTPQEIAAALREPFPWPELEHRVQGKPSSNGRIQMLTYVQRKAIIDRLDAVVGPNNWQDTYEMWTGGESAKCKLSLRISGEWITKEDAAAETDIEAVKGGITNALKRAASKWGIGLYLYDFPTCWLEGKKVGDKVYPPDNAGQQILERVRKEAPHLLHQGDLPKDQQRKPPAAPKNLLSKLAEPPPWLDDELDRGRFAGTRWAWFLEPSEDGGRIGYLVHLIESEEPSDWSVRAAQCYLYRCTKAWFSPKLQNGASLLSINVIAMCKEKGLNP